MPVLYRGSAVPKDKTFFDNIGRWRKGNCNRIFPSTSGSPVSIVPATTHTDPQTSPKHQNTKTPTPDRRYINPHLYKPHQSFPSLFSSVIYDKEDKARSSWLYNFLQPSVTLIFSPTPSAQTQSKNLIFVVPCIMLYSGEISPTRCNNCVFYSQWLYSTCFGWQSHPSSEVQCCICPQVSWLT